MGLRWPYFKTEVSEYIAEKISSRSRKIFVTESHQAAPLLRLSACLFSNTSVWECAGSGADGWGILPGERGQPGDVTLEESAENLRGGKMLLSGAQGLFERSELTGAPLCT